VRCEGEDEREGERGSTIMTEVFTETICKTSLASNNLGYNILTFGLHWQ